MASNHTVWQWIQRGVNILCLEGVQTGSGKTWPTYTLAPLPTVKDMRFHRVLCINVLHIFSVRFIKPFGADYENISFLCAMHTNTKYSKMWITFCKYIHHTNTYSISLTSVNSVGLQLSAQTHKNGKAAPTLFVQILFLGRLVLLRARKVLSFLWWDKTIKIRCRVTQKLLFARQWNMFANNFVLEMWLLESNTVLCFWLHFMMISTKLFKK